MIKCFDVANYFLSLSNDGISGDLMSNLKLQKLVYYAQGFYLAMFDKPLFNETIEAWTYGPVCPELYHKYKKYESSAIQVPENIDFAIYDNDLISFLDEIYEVYGQFSAWKLMNMTHVEPPWKDTKIGDIITHNALKSYFKTMVSD